MQCRGRVSRPVTPSSSIFRQKTPIIGLCVPFQPLRGRQIFSPPSPQAQKLRTIKNSLTFELKAQPFTAITLTGQIIPALNFSREFLRDLLGCGASQAGLAERGDLKLLSFVLSFQKRKYINERRLQKTPALMISARLAMQTPSVIFSRKCHLPQRGRQIPSTQRSLQVCSTRLQISLGEGGKYLPSPREQKPCAKHNRSAPQAHIFSSPFSFLSSPNFMPRKTKICPLAKAYFCFEAGYLVVCSATVSVSSLGRKRSEMHQMLARATSV